MAYVPTVTREIGPVLNGRPTWTYTIIEDGEIATASEWSIVGLPRQCTITLLECNIITAGGVATTQNEIGWVAGWTTDERGHIDKADTAGTPVRIAQNKRATLGTGGALFGRSLPDTTGGATTQIETIVSVTAGHI